jgi:hypothetical protein
VLDALAECREGVFVFAPRLFIGGRRALIDRSGFSLDRSGRRARQRLARQFAV